MSVSPPQSPSHIEANRLQEWKIKFAQQGIVALAKRNKKFRFFLASKENFFGGFQVENVMIDNGCSSILLPLNEGDIQQLRTTFPPQIYSWTIANSKGVQARSLTLEVAPKPLFNAPTQITIQLCRNFLDTSCPVQKLRFHVCNDDCAPLLAGNMLPQTEKNKIITFQTKNSLHVPRRSHALIGQGILSQDSYASIQLRSGFIVVTTTKFALTSWQDIMELNLFLGSEEVQDLLPDNFEDLEDEDHDGIDEELYWMEDDFDD